MVRLSNNNGGGGSSGGNPAPPDRSIQIDDGGAFGSAGWLIDTSSNQYTTGVTRTTATNSLGFGVISGGTIQIIGGGSLAHGGGSATIIIAGQSSHSFGAGFSGFSIQANNQSQAFGSGSGNGVQANNQSQAFGASSDDGSGLLANHQSLAFGSKSTGGTLSSDNQSLTHGISYNSGTLSATVNGSQVFGVANAGTIRTINSGVGGLAHGVALNGALISVELDGGTASGYTANSAEIISRSLGAFAGGVSLNDSSIDGAANGVFVHGYAAGGSVLTGTGLGATVLGVAVGNSNTEIRSAGDGSLAGGYALNGNKIQATQAGSLAWGNTGTYGNVIASGANAVAIGSGITNSTDNSFMIGWGAAAFYADYTGLINLAPTLELQLNGDPGSTGEVITSNGPGLPPTWQPGGSGGGGISIPNPEVILIGGSGVQNKHGEEPGLSSEDPIQVGVFWKPWNDTFAVYNPRIFLYRYKKTSKQTHDGATRTYRKKGFVHPTNNNGVDYPSSKWFGGMQTDWPDRTTEWSCPTTPYTKVFFAIDPKEWHGKNPNFANPVFPILVPDYEGDVVQSSIPPIRKYLNTKTVKKVLVFKFAIVIDNPDPATSEAIPFLVSDLSQTLKIYPKVGTFSDGSYYYSWTAKLGSPNKSY